MLYSFKLYSCIIYYTRIKGLKMKNVQIRIKYTQEDGSEINTTVTIKDYLLNLYAKVFFKRRRYNDVKKELHQRIRKTILEDFKENENFPRKKASQRISATMMFQIGREFDRLNEQIRDRELEI